MSIHNSRDINFWDAKIYHYTSGPIDRPEECNFISILDLKEELFKRLNSNTKTWFGYEYFSYLSLVLLKRVLTTMWRQDFRDKDIWYYFSLRGPCPEEECSLENVLLYIKEDNNGTSHLFSFFPLPEVANNDANWTEIYGSFPHEYDDDWALEMTQHEIKERKAKEEAQKRDDRMRQEYFKKLKNPFMPS